MLSRAHISICWQGRLARGLSPSLSRSKRSSPCLNTRRDTSKFVSRQLDRQTEARSWQGLRRATYFMSKRFNSDESMESGNFSENLFEDEDPLKNSRHYLFPDSEDQVISKLAMANSVQRVFDVVGNLPKEEFSSIRAMQAVETLYHLQKISLNKASNGQNLYSDVTLLNSIKNFNSVIKAHALFETIVKHIQNLPEELEMAKVAQIFMCLERLGVSLAHPTLQTIQIALLRRADDLDLTALSYLSAGLKGLTVRHKGLLTPLTLSRLLPTFRKLIEATTTPKEALQCTICINACPVIISDDLMNVFASKIIRMIDEDVFQTEADYKCLVRTAGLFVVMRQWFDLNLGFIVRIMDHLSGHVHLLKPLHVISLGVLTRGEKRGLLRTSLVTKIEKRLDEILKNEETSVMFQLNAASLLWEIKKQNLDKDKVTSLIQKGMEVGILTESLTTFVNLFQNSQVHDLDLWRRFLDKIFDGVSKEPALCHEVMLMYGKFLQFDFTVKSRSFEQKALEHFQEKSRLCNEMNDFIHSICVELFLNRTSDSALIKRFEEAIPRCPWNLLRPVHNIIVSKRARTKGFHRKFAINSLQSLVCTRVSELLDQNPTLIMKLKLQLILSLEGADQKAEMDTLLDEALDKLTFHEIILHVVPILRKAIFSGHPTFLLTDSRWKKISDIALQNTDFIHFSVVENLLLIGYYSNCKMDQDFLDLCNDISLREFDAQFGLSLNTVALKLAKYRSLSKELTDRIFCDKNMETLDQELKFRGEHSSYGKSVRSSLLQLNRAVCLLYPEYDVPWFHGKAFSNILFSDGKRNSSDQEVLIKSEIRQRLQSVLGGSKFLRKSVISPYLNNIDFEFHMDAHGKAVNLESLSTEEDAQDIPPNAERGGSQVKRVAVIVVPSRAICQSTRKLSGELDLTVELLELQGYNVVLVDPYEWRALHMSDELQKENCLLNKIHAVI